MDNNEFKAEAEPCNGQNNQLILRAHFDKELIWELGRSVRYLQVDVDAQNAPAGVIEKRTPLNVALAIDVSGSMAGAPLQSAKQAAIGLIRGLSDEDRLSIVSFSNTAVVHLNGASLAGEERAAAIAAVSQLNSRSDTNLSAGWLKAAECVAAAIATQEHDGFHSHVIVLSDGYANAGITNPAGLEVHAAQLRMRGLFTSAVGIGDQYSATQLEALAVHGGGRLHDAQYPMEIVEVVLGELYELSTTQFDDINVEMRLPGGVEVANISGFPANVGAERISTSIGSLGAGGARTVIFRLRAPAGQPGDRLWINVAVSWKEPGNVEVKRGAEKQCALTFAAEARNLTQHRNETICLQVARVWQAAVVKHAVSLNRSSHLRDLTRYLDQQIAYFNRYIAGLPNAEHLVMELVSMRSVSNREWDERSRKDMQITTHYLQQGHTDHRKNKRQAWYENLPIDD